MFWVGRYLGICGTILLLLSFVYSLRKRKIINVESPKRLLNAHEYLSWAGVLTILVHAGWHFNAVLPWLAVLLLVVVVASEFTGKFLLREARERLYVRREQLQAAGELSREALERKLFFDSLTVDLMQNWRYIHLPLTAMFTALTTVHTSGLMRTILRDAKRVIWTRVRLQATPVTVVTRILQDACFPCTRKKVSGMSIAARNAIGPVVRREPNVENATDILVRS